MSDGCRDKAARGRSLLLKGKGGRAIKRGSSARRRPEEETDGSLRNTLGEWHGNAERKKTPPRHPFACKAGGDCGLAPDRRRPIDGAQNLMKWRAATPSPPRSSAPRALTSERGNP